MKTHQLKPKRVNEQLMIDKTLQQAIRTYGEPIGEGLSRVVFKVDNTTVLKIPKHPGGVADNYSEDYKYQRWSNEGIYAKCWLETSEYAIPVLYMEYVEQISDRNLPGWTDFIDCQQVGYTVDARLVAYDYA